jgi:hypothetical protein
MRRVCILALGLLLLWLSIAPAQAQQSPETVVCWAGQPVRLTGQAPALSGLLLTFADRVVGGGTADAGGQYALTLVVGQEPPGTYAVTVQRRDGGAVLRRLLCQVPDGPMPRPSPTPLPTVVPTALPLVPVAAPVAPAVAPAPTADQPTPAAPSLAALSTLAPSPTVSPLADTPVPLPTSSPALSVTVTVPLRAGYDANQNQVLDPNEGIAGLVVYVADPMGRVLGQATTNERGTVEIPIAVSDPDLALTISIPYFSVAQVVGADNPRPQPVVIPGQARLPALLP